MHEIKLICKVSIGILKSAALRSNGKFQITLLMKFTGHVPQLQQQNQYKHQKIQLHSKRHCRKLILFGPVVRIKNVFYLIFYSFYGC